MKSTYYRRATLLSIALVCAISIAGVGCRKTAQAPSETVDLSEPKDLFTRPVQDTLTGSPDSPIVKINDEVITRGDLQAELDRVLKVVERRLPPERVEQLKPRLLQQSLESLMLKKLLLQAVAEEQIVVTDEEFAEGKQKFIESLPEGMALDDVLKMSEWTEEEFERNLRTDLAINKLLEKHVADVQAPTDEEVKEFYEDNPSRFEAPESVSARHILVAVAPTDSAEEKAAKREKAEQIRKKLLEGADFAEMAKEYSDCPSKTRGGDLGTFSRGQMVKEFEDAAFSQATNEIGPIVETPFGFHIIQVLSHTDAHKVGLDEVKTRLTQGLLAQRRQRAAQQYVTQLRNRAKIEFLDPSFQPQQPTLPDLSEE